MTLSPWVVAVLALLLMLSGCGEVASVEPCRNGECIPVPSGDVTLALELDLPPGPGPHPVLVMVHGSGRGTRADFAGVVDTYRSSGIGIARYDKRGAGDSTGRFHDVDAGNSRDVFDLLADDLVAVVEHVATEPGVDPDRIGAIGVSQAGWIMPLAAGRSERIAYMISISGAASSVGVSDRFDRIAEDTPDPVQVATELAAFDGEHGYDPAADLAVLTIPALWIYGGRDTSNPTANDVAVLERIAAEHDVDFEIHVLPDADHALIDARTGRPADAQSIVDRWLTERILAPR